MESYELAERKGYVAARRATPAAGLAEVLMSAYRAPTPKNLGAALKLLFTGGRLGELLYGAWCFVRHSPTVMHPSLNISAGWLAELDTRRVDGWFTVEQMRSHPEHRPFLSGVPAHCTFRGTSLCRFGSFIVAGEYGEGKRLYHGELGGAARAHDKYVEDAAVRHIHSIFRLGPSEFLVTTGDSAKYLDLWAFEDNEIKFVRRLRSRLAGYTAIVRVGGDLYFGSDFSGRPNYLLRDRDRKKFILPREIWTEYIADAVCFDDRYILVASCNLVALGERRSFAVFDTKTEKFHAL